MHTSTVALGVTAALLHAVAYILYIIQTKKGTSKPNAVSWSIWAFTSILNAFSYREMSGDTVASLQSFTGAAMCFLTFILALGGGKFSWPTWKEWRVFGIGIAATFVWCLLKSATGAQIILTVAFLISFYPTFRGVLEDPWKETPLSWCLWTAAFAMTTMTVIVRWNGRPMSLLMPVVLLFAHGSIAYLSSDKRKEWFRQKLSERKHWRRSS